MIHVALRFELVPDVIDLTHVLTLSGFGAYAMTLVGAVLRFDADRLARLVMLGNLVGGITGLLFALLVALGVFS